MKFKSQIVTQASGSIGGTTYSRNRFGLYTRARAIPTNPGSPQQSAVRGFFAQLADLWSNTLTGGQRALWAFYASQVPVIDVLGDPVFLTGFNHYLRSNVPRLQGGDPRVDSGPTSFNLGDYTNPSFSLDEPNDEIDVTFEAADDWANEDDAAMYVYCSRPQPITVNYFTGPYRFAGAIQGDAAMAPTSPAAITLPFSVAAGQRIFARVQVSRADGRYSAPFRGQSDA